MEGLTHNSILVIKNTSKPKSCRYPQAVYLIVLVIILY